MTTLRATPVPSLAGTIRVPSDASITHRALLLAAVSDRAVTITGGLDSDDTAATLTAVEACGVEVSGHLGGTLVVRGRGLRGLRPSPHIDCANADALMRLLPGLLVGTGAEYLILDGDDALRARPVAGVATALRRMGASVFTAPGGTPPLVVNGGRPLTGMRHELAAPDDAAKGGILLAGLHAAGETWVAEPAPSPDHTERMLAAAGVEVLRDGDAVGLRGPVAALTLPDLRVPGDFGAAAFHLVAGALLGDPGVRLEEVNLNPRRTGLLEVMRRMGADIAVEEGESLAGEPCGTIIVRRAEALRAARVTAGEVPALADELPLVGLLGAMAHGTTEVRGADPGRAGATVDALRAMGVEAERLDDGFRVAGAGAIPGGEMTTGHDHRMAMLGAVAGLASTEGVAVHGFEACRASYPAFPRDLAALGAA